MQVMESIPAVWVYTTNAASQTIRAQGYGAFLSREQQARLERIRQARLLFDGQHKQYYLDEDRTQFTWPAAQVNSMMVQPFITLNLLRLISFKGADLLFGDEPLLRVEDVYQQAFLSDLADRSSLHQLFYAKALDCSYEGEAFIEAVLCQGQPYLKEMDAAEVFPVGGIGPDKQYHRYDRYRMKNVGTEVSPIMLLLKEIYLPGRIERHVYQLDDKGKIMREVTIESWPMDDGSPPLEPLTLTGIAMNTITWIPNQLVRGQPISDYDGAIELQDELNAKQTQIARVLAIHANPKMAFPRNAADPQGRIPAGYEVSFFDDPANIPKYLTWAGSELEWAIKDRDFTRDALLMACEMSPILLGIKAAGSHAEAFKTVRVQAYNSTTKAARKAVYWTTGIRRCIGVAQALSHAAGSRYEQGQLGVQLRDGLPVDDLDQANRLSILRAAGLMSVRGGLMELKGGDVASVDAEAAELEKENAGKTPSIFMGMGTPGGQEQTTQTGESEETADAAAATEDGAEVAA
jgi:hypothetical protein